MGKKLRRKSRENKGRGCERKNKNKKKRRRRRRRLNHNGVDVGRLGGGRPRQLESGEGRYAETTGSECRSELAASAFRLDHVIPPSEFITSSAPHCSLVLLSPAASRLRALSLSHTHTHTQEGEEGGGGGINTQPVMNVFSQIKTLFCSICFSFQALRWGHHGRRNQKVPLLTATGQSLALQSYSPSCIR